MIGAPGIQCVMALKKRIFRVMESPTMRVVGGNSGRGGLGFSGIEDGR